MAVDLAVDPERATASDLEPVKPDPMQRDGFYPWPDSVKRRIEALKKLQLKTSRIKAKFYKEVHALECRYQELYAIYYKQRSKIISGTYEPTENECAWESKNEKKISEDLISKVGFTKVKEKAGPKKAETGADEEDVKGIPDFWLTVLKNYELLPRGIHKHDEPIFKHMNDFKVQLLKKNPMGFVLEFHFSPNEYFSNLVLTIELHTKCKPTKKYPFTSKGPRIYKCNGCTIDWKEGMNVRAAHSYSFFDIFTSVNKYQRKDLFHFGNNIRKDKIAHRAVLYYTAMRCESEDEDESDDYRHLTLCYDLYDTSDDDDSKQTQLFQDIKNAQNAQMAASRARKSSSSSSSSTTTTSSSSLDNWIHRYNL